MSPSKHRKPHSSWQEFIDILSLLLQSDIMSKHPLFLPELPMFVFHCHSPFKGNNNICQMAQCSEWFTFITTWVIGLLGMCLKFWTSSCCPKISLLWWWSSNALWTTICNESRWCLHHPTSWFTVYTPFYLHYVIQLFIQSISSQRALEWPINSWLAMNLTVTHSSKCDEISKIQVLSLLLSAQISWHWQFSGQPCMHSTL